MSGWIPSNSISTHCTYHQTWLSGCSAVFSAADRAGKFILPHSAHLKPQHLRLTFTFVWLGPQLSYVFVPFGHHPLVLLHPAVSGAADNVGHSVYSRGCLFGQIWCTTAEVGLVITQSYSHNEPPTDDSSTGGKESFYSHSLVLKFLERPEIRYKAQLNLHI